MKYLTLIFLLGGLALNLRGGSSAPGDTNIPFEAATGILGYSLAQAQRVEIYEGLPREQAGSDIKKNLDTCRQIAGQWVYSVPEEIRPKHAMKLQHLLDEGLFQPWREGKLGGGFHADYVIGVPRPKDTLYVLVCFECQEARIVREGSPFAADPRSPDFRLTTGLNSKNFEELRSLLTGYHQTQPQ